MLVAGYKQKRGQNRRARLPVSLGSALFCPAVPVPFFEIALSFSVQIFGFVFKYLTQVLESNSKRLKPTTV